ncbi:MAG: transketolase [Gammaproteobacteria bacterium]|tara:strand:+ start:4287 stop:5096 length:810 start_codon:yes stop_codon:yes gene_type:complete
MKSVQLAQKVRLKALELCYKKNASHLGGSLSIADVLAVLYSGFLEIDPKDPDNRSRDRLFYGKGHACTALYAVLDECGFLRDYNLVEDFIKDGTFFTAHVSHHLPGIELSTGSLGHALGVACGVSKALKLKGQKNHVFSIVSDGELDEGSTWEALLFASHHKLNNLTIIVDFNKIQSFGNVEDVLNLEPLKSKMDSFGFECLDIDGHSHKEISSSLKYAKSERAKPLVILANTIKGKGVSFMENKLLWHYKSPDKKQYEQAIREIKSKS